MLIFILILSFICTTFNVWFIHWILHRGWIIKYYDKHLQHHIAGTEDHFLFSRISIPFFIVISILGIIGLFSIKFTVINIICTTFWILLHDIFHYLYHKGKFNKLKKIHFIHHNDIRYNYGIYFMIWDKLFKTFKE